MLPDMTFITTAQILQSKQKFLLPRIALKRPSRICNNLCICYHHLDVLDYDPSVSNLHRSFFGIFFIVNIDTEYKQIN